MEKRCSRWGEVEPRAAFAADRAARDRLQAYCRTCWAECHRARQLAKGENVRPRVETPEGYRHRRSCGETDPHSEWHRKASASDGLSTSCKACRAEKGRAGPLKRRYGLTDAERDQLIADQGGVCCICRAAPAAHVDHCHETGRVRGVLCFSCNAALGQFKDRPDAIRRAAAYVEGIAWKPTLVAPGVCQLPS
ncbi:endonuclease VII domain-containing protein [Streptomyces sp. MH13]|uniref:endonuclease VII domain-containing protein n=1 Tax=Streptomyces sp. MH13 TaxID=3417651 RepID=UPI003CF6C5AC